MLTKWFKDTIQSLVLFYSDMQSISTMWMSTQSNFSFIQCQPNAPSFIVSFVQSSGPCVSGPFLFTHSGLGPLARVVTFLHLGLGPKGPFLFPKDDWPVGLGPSCWGPLSEACTVDFLWFPRFNSSILAHVDILGHWSNRQALHVDHKWRRVFESGCLATTNRLVYSTTLVYWNRLKSFNWWQPPRKGSS